MGPWNGLLGVIVLFGPGRAPVSERRLLDGRQTPQKHSLLHTLGSLHGCAPRAIRGLCSREITEATGNRGRLLVCPTSCYPTVSIENNFNHPVDGWL